jgi:uncharacterized membrane protein (UPF0136 family)
VQVREVSEVSLVGLCFLGALLVLPAYAWHQMGWEIWKLATYAGALSLITYAAYASDKRKARKQLRDIEAPLATIEPEPATSAK